MLMDFLQLLKELVIDAWFAWIPFLLGIVVCDFLAKPARGEEAVC